jgi:hypothetical protein
MRFPVGPGVMLTLGFRRGMHKILSSNEVIAGFPARAIRRQNQPTVAELPPIAGAAFWGGAPLRKRAPPGSPIRPNIRKSMISARFQEIGEQNLWP